MSMVTSVVLFSASVSVETLKKLEEGYLSGDRVVQFKLLDTLDIREYTAGSKLPEVEIGIAGFNYLDWEEFCYWLTNLEWDTTTVVIGEFNHESGPKVLIIPGSDSYSIHVATDKYQSHERFYRD